MNRYLIVTGTAVLLLAVGLSGCNETTHQSTENKVYLMSQQFLEDVLVAPATAQYPDISEAIIKQKTTNEWAVLSYVDSQNSFGALIRSWYACEMAQNADGSWTCLYINTEDNKVDANLKWSEVTYFTGSEDKKTNLFNINTNIWRIEWETGGTDYSNSYYIEPSPMFWFTIHDTSDNYIDYVSGDGSYDSGIEYYEGSGQYYLDINSYDLTSWTISVYKASLIV